MLKTLLRLIDGVLDRSSRAIVNHETLSDQMEKISTFAPDKFAYVREQIDTVQSRAAALLSHISLLLAVLAISMSIYDHLTIMLSFLSACMVALLFVSLALLRIVGAAVKDDWVITDKESYVERVFQECVSRFRLFRFSVLVTVGITAAILVAVVVYPPVLAVTGGAEAPNATSETGDAVAPSMGQ